jgi:hypothetical protein
MTSSTVAITAAGVLALAVAGMTSVAAQASYLGYGNGDPGNWGFATEQEGGPCAGVKAHAGRMPKCCLKYNPMHVCPDMLQRTAYIVPPLASIVR